MSGEIKKIDSIKNMAVFHDFKWSTSVRDDGNNVAEFKNINIIYGRNYSGKTTISRAVRALETGFISEKYDNPEFIFSFEGGRNATHVSLKNHGQIIRVFNEDFVKENLKFIVDHDQAINSFAILGEDNTRIKEEIELHETELGNTEQCTGLIGSFLAAQKKFEEANNNLTDKQSEIENKLRDKANKSGSGIKHNKFFGDANYNVTKIKSDISTINEATYTPLSSDEISNHQNLLREIPKNEMPPLEPFNLKYNAIFSKSKNLVEKKILPSDPINELLNDSLLEIWVRSGRDHHKNKRDKCAFCGGELPKDLWEKLDKHFNQESEELRKEIDIILIDIEKEKSKIQNIFNIKNSDFYTNYHDELDAITDNFSTNKKLYIENLDSLKKQVEQRKNDIFNAFILIEPLSCVSKLEQIHIDYEKIRFNSNDFTSSLSKEQLKARVALRLQEVRTFINDINYIEECAVIEILKELKNKMEEKKDLANSEVTKKRAIITELKAKLKDESKGAERVNDYLNNFFGHKSLLLKAIEEKFEDESAGYRFEVTRNERKAFHLSEGECSLIAFCYFMAKLEDIETKGNQPIIWIDDPICSLDSNHIFFIYSIINTKIVAPEKYQEDGVLKERPRFKQLFISTHNLDFLKYLKRLTGALNKKTSQYFIIRRAYQESTISIMPKYLKEYVTEFNFLFHQIFKCANAKIDHDENHDCYYNFGNNARKFLEAFLYYRYPDANEKDDKLARFFGDDTLAASLTDRINNEYSHLAGVFERSMLPIDIPEMKTTASYILKKIKEKDPDQYTALLTSIGEKDFY